MLTTREVAVAKAARAMYEELLTHRCVPDYNLRNTALSFDETRSIRDIVIDPTLTVPTCVGENSVQLQLTFKGPLYGGNRGIFTPLNVTGEQLNAMLEENRNLKKLQADNRELKDLLNAALDREQKLQAHKEKVWAAVMSTVE